LNFLDDHLNKRLQARKENGLYRTLHLPSSQIDFSSNDYLGLARSGELHQRILNTIHELALPLNGSTGSRLLTGNSDYVCQVEKKLARIFQSERALLFNSGYTANVGVLSTLPQKGDTILYDELAHASIKDGARLSLATKFSFKHNDLNDLERKIKKSTGKIYIAVESIYSMDGDECPLPELVDLQIKHHATIILDEAHSTGVMGKDGGGLAVSQSLHNKIPVRIYTFGKAMGCHGACVAGSEVLINYLVNFSRPFIYTTALSPHSIASIDCAFEFLRDHPTLQQQLEGNIDLYRQASKNLYQHHESKSAIQTLVIPGNTNIRSAANQLQQAGLDVRPILSPTVPVGSERLRICLHAYNTPQEITTLTEALHSLIQKDS
jgi:8-amino-7-oxononanoate synthase